MPVRKDPTLLKRMVVRIREKGGDLSRAFAIATAQAQRMGFLKAGSRELTAKGRAKEASYTQEQRDEAEEALAEYVELERRTSTKPTKGRAKAQPKQRKIGLAPPTLSATAYGLTDIGKVRTNNEDAFLVTPNLWVVSDGIGGADGGEIASRACVLGAKAALREGENGPELLHSTVKHALAKMPKGFRGGATIVEATLAGTTLFVGNIGDSRAYLVSSAGKMKRLTKDHQERGNVLTRWVGPRSQKLGQVDLSTAKIEPGARLLLCSDGVYGLVNDYEILRLMRFAETPKEAANVLVDSALRAGGNDNATAIVVFFGAKGRGGSRTKAQPKAPAKRAKVPAAKKAPAKRAKTPAPRAPRATQAPARGSIASMRPMLAKVFTGMKPGHSYVAEPKIDGYRLLAKRTASGVVFETRKGNSQPYTKNLRVIGASIERMLSPGQVLDGEILVKDFENTALVRTKNLSDAEQKALDKDAVFWAFDMPSVGGTHAERRKALIKTLRDAHGSYKVGIRLMPSAPVADDDAARYAAKKFHEAGYEGAVIKDTGALYSAGRRTDAFTKIKFHDDVTAKVVGFEEGKGKDAGRLGSLRVLYKGKEIGVGTGFSAKDRTDIWRNRAKLKGAKVDIIVGKNENGGKSKRPTTFVRFRQGD